MSERDHYAGMLDAVRLLGGYAFRCNTGVFGARRVRSAPAGTPDIVGVLRGRFIGIEAKGSRGKLSKEQLQWHEKARAAGGVIVVAREAEDVMHALWDVAVVR